LFFHRLHLLALLFANLLYGNNLNYKSNVKLL
jgi:hypothetical protein